MAEEENTTDLQRLNDGTLAVTVLRDIAINATRKDFGYCPKCRSKVQVDRADLSSRVQAARALAGNTEDKPLDTTLDPANLTPSQRAQLHIWALNAGAPDVAAPRAHTREEEAAGQA